MRWEGHTIHMKRWGNAYDILIKMPEGKSQLGKGHMKWTERYISYEDVD
jgi:hypothetical protein